MDNSLITSRKDLKKTRHNPDEQLAAAVVAANPSQIPRSFESHGKLQDINLPGVLGRCVQCHRAESGAQLAQAVLSLAPISQARQQFDMFLAAKEPFRKRMMKKNKEG